MKYDKLIMEMSSGIQAVKMGTYVRLSIKYSNKYKSPTFLAVAVINELFMEDVPSTDEALKYKNSHMDIINNELSYIKDDRDMCLMIYAALIVQSYIYERSGVKSASSLIEHDLKMTRLGIVHKDSFEISNHPHVFITKANEYQTISAYDMQIYKKISM